MKPEKIIYTTLGTVLAILLIICAYFFISYLGVKNDVEISVIDFGDKKPKTEPVDSTIYFKTLSFTRDNDGKVTGKVLYGTTTDIELGVKPYELDIDSENFVKRSDRIPYLYGYAQVIKIGVIKNGELKGKEVFSIFVEGEIGGSTFDSYLILAKQNLYVQFDGSGNTFSITEKYLPQNISLPGTDYHLEKGGIVLMLNATTTESFMVEGRKFLILNGNCIVTEAYIGGYYEYTFNYSLINKREREIIIFKTLDGKQNTESYNYTMPACEYGCVFPTTVKISNINSGEYKVIAKDPDNKEIYTYKDPKNPELLKLYNDKNTSAYFEVDDGYRNLEKSKYSYEEFLSYNPVLFWQDALGNWIKFTNTRFTPLAEKCKPVIYLYPKTDMNLNVQVTPNGGFTKTIPAYPTGGWNVFATPESVIKDLSSGNTYPYLYWSGMGKNYPVDYTIGSLVKKENVSAFLDEKLVKLGMNSKEISDFKEYWVPKLSVNNYYQIYFLSKAQIDHMDPLQISPVKPDNIIRVMLTAKGLDNPVELKEQILPTTPKRDGFTVVEWGGVLLR